MTESPEDPNPLDGITGRVRAADMLLILAEQRADMRRVVESTTRIESGLSALSLRVSALEVDVASMKATQSAMQKAEEASTPLRTSPWTVVSVLIAAAAVIVSLLLDAYHGG